MKRITIPKPFDAHNHLRIGAWLKTYFPLAVKIFSGLVAMGNLPKPIKDAAGMKRYREEIPNPGALFDLIMTFMLVNSTTPRIVKEARNAGAGALKLIPGGTSTNSDEGVALVNLPQFYPVLEMARDLSMPFLGHWELAVDPKTGQEIPEWQREIRALPYLQRTVEDVPSLIIFGEHASTKAMIDFIKQASENIFMTLTLKHGIITYEDVFDRPMGEPNPAIRNPLLYCKPVVKSEGDRQAVVEAWISGDPKCIYGSDNAPHPIARKMGPNPDAGICTLPDVEISKFCEIFDELGELDKLGHFLCLNGRRAYGLGPPQEAITLVKDSWVAPEESCGARLFLGGERIKWRVEK